MAGIKVVIVWGLRLALAAVFLYAGVVKLISPDAFLADIESYRLLPYRAAWLIAYYLPALEVLVGVAILVPAWNRAAALVMGGMMGVFILALLSAWARGLDISCGCFGRSPETRQYLWLFVRDILLVVALVGVWRYTPIPKADCAGSNKLAIRNSYS